jgi:uracil-DNA glycosylase
MFFVICVNIFLGCDLMFNKEWDIVLKDEIEKEYFKNLEIFILNEYKNKICYPIYSDIYNSLKYTDYSNVRVVIIGQDPYHGDGEAHGLAFSVNEGVKRPPSLANIFKELETDVGVKYPVSGNLTPWANQGVLLLNSVLTVNKGDANSHSKQGWEIFTSKILEIILQLSQPKVFILWGTQAQKTFFSVYNKQSNVCYIKSAHPSPLSAYRDFFNSKPFSKTNSYLKNHNVEPVDWSIF